MSIPLQILRPTLANLGLAAERAAHAQGFGCGPRCSFCCERPVPVSDEEADLIANQIKAQGGGAIARTLEAVEAWEVATALPGPDGAPVRVAATASYQAACELGIVGLATLAAKLPRAGCPLLQGDERGTQLCRLYEQRPSECRLHFARGPVEACNGMGGADSPTRIEVLDARPARTRLHGELGLILTDLLPLALKKRLALKLA